LEALWDTNGRDHWIVVDPGRGVPLNTLAPGGTTKCSKAGRLNSPSVSGVFASSGQIWRPGSDIVHGGLPLIMAVMLMFSSVICVALAVRSDSECC